MDAQLLMAQASSWKQLAHSLNRVAIDWRGWRRLARFRGPGGWLMVLTLVVALWLWNWPLMLATLAGLLGLLLAYGAQQYRWQNTIWQRLWGRSNRQLTISVLLGGLATISTYMGAMVWLAAESGWLAVGTVLQGLGTLAIGLLLLFQIAGRSPQPVNEMQMLSRLSTADALDRLIAIRQVTAWADTASPQLRAQVADCFRLMLQTEAEPLLHSALLDGLQALLPAASERGLDSETPVAIPIALHSEAKQMVDRDLDVRKT